MNYTYPIPKLFLRLFTYELIFWVVFILSIILINYCSTEDSLFFKFENRFYLLSLLVPFYCGIFYVANWRNKRIKKLGNTPALSSVLKVISVKQTFWKLFFARNLLVFVVLAMTQPIYGKKQVTGKTREMELVVAVDISNSMNVCDISPEISRLEIVKRALNQLVNQLNGEKIGLVVFAGGTFTHLPLTLDYDATKFYIQEIKTNMLQKQGTNIASALNESIKMFSKSEISKSIVVVTDGEHHEGNFNEAIDALKTNKINLSILGIGTIQGGKIPNNPSRQELGYKKDNNGNYVISKVNPQLITELAKQANGISILSSTAFPDMEELLYSLKKIKNYTDSNQQITAKYNWFQVMTLLALLNLIGLFGINESIIFSKK